MAVSAEEFRNALRCWASGVSIVTTRHDDGIRGITVSSFCSLSLDPPLILICIARNARSHELIARQKAFAVNILGAGQRRLSDRAAGRLGEEGTRLEGLPHRTAVTGAPILEDAIAWLDCALVDRHPGGDHTIFVGRVEAAGAGAGRPLLYCRSSYRKLAPPTARSKRHVARPKPRPRRRSRSRT